jgi:hypothetical protein
MLAFLHCAKVIKDNCSTAVVASYGLYQGCATLVKNLFDDASYIFGATHSDPYQHPCIISQLHYGFFMSSTSIGNQYAGQFPTGPATDDGCTEVPAPMVVLVSTAVSFCVYLMFIVLISL